MDYLKTCDIIIIIIIVGTGAVHPLAKQLSSWNSLNQA